MALSDFFLEIIVFQLAAIAALAGIVYRTLQDKISGNEADIAKLDEDVVHLTEEVEKQNHELDAIKRTMYGHGEDETERGHIYETERQLDDIRDSVDSLRKEMKREHKEAKNGIRSIIEYLRREEENFDADGIFDD